MWEDEILEELHRIRVRAASPSGEEHAQSFNYDFKAIFADWQKRQAASGRDVVSLQPKQQSHNTVQRTEQRYSLIRNS